jgi:phenylpyruvate tautomerase PptA (4-oxalocrotonate tautomerase family)
MSEGREPMAQVKVYGLGERLRPIRASLSDTIHACVVEALDYPRDKRFQRFFPLEREDFVHPADRGDGYTIVEISMFEGRSIEARKRLVRLLFERLERECAIPPGDLEITITETPQHNWGIRGRPGDELALGYRVDV